ncbi:hypothetical protein EJ03DRAFT_95815 [Teratosphaeria nubilosa]|uniref:Uncharacterized protein n=1 Tax=Teratosphaeria nubilosa TaxID=161662 RepID=A0A6G1L938_9PEZI|nr:hypothetical protein EJ03DRAFT_95815 [Teratosphaeria nubilosa]
MSDQKRNTLFLAMVELYNHQKTFSQLTIYPAINTNQHHPRTTPPMSSKAINPNCDYTTTHHPLHQNTITNRRASPTHRTKLRRVQSSPNLRASSTQPRSDHNDSNTPGTFGLSPSTTQKEPTRASDKTQLPDADIDEARPDSPTLPPSSTASKK